MKRLITLLLSLYIGSVWADGITNSFPIADQNNIGMVTTGSQTFSGAKTFNNGASIVGNLSASGVIGETGSNPTLLGANGTEQARIDTSGNFGLATTPYATSTWPTMFFKDKPSIGADVNTLYIASNIKNGWSSPQYIASQAAAAYQIDGSAGVHRWYTAPSGTAGAGVSISQVMTVDNSGNLLVGQTATGLQNSTSVAIGPGPTGGVFNHASGTATATAYAVFGYNAGNIGSITQNGTTAVLYNTTSDYRLKSNVTPITGGIETISKLKPVTFTWNSDGSADAGFIAHEFQSVIPRYVIGQKDAVDADGNPIYQQMDSKGAIPFLVSAVKELNTELTQLQSDFNAYKATHP